MTFNSVKTRNLHRCMVWLSNFDSYGQRHTIYRTGTKWYGNICDGYIFYVKVLGFGLYEAYNYISLMVVVVFYIVVGYQRIIYGGNEFY